MNLSGQIRSQKVPALCVKKDENPKKSGFGVCKAPKQNKQTVLPDWHLPEP